MISVSLCKCLYVYIFVFCPFDVFTTAHNQVRMSSKGRDTSAARMNSAYPDHPSHGGRASARHQSSHGVPMVTPSDRSMGRPQGSAHVTSGGPVGPKRESSKLDKKQLSGKNPYTSSMV